ncbi:MAG TPA: aminoglycoside adenylyltransferase domain-containing protein [Chloroflexia bacterium]|nr:aminoglycoside adenylyltransferase domain-containing protein [Chloroflexia bacterium]
MREPLLNTPIPNPTPYPDVNAMLHELLSSVQAILGDHFLGMYLYGSLALGDFDPHRSDIDFLVVTTDDLPTNLFLALQAMHARIAAGDSRWAIELEGSYIPQHALRRYDQTNARHPHIDRGGGNLDIEQHDTDWVIQRHTLREHGVVLLGPAPHTLIDPVHPNDLRHAAMATLSEWWAPMCDRPIQLQYVGYQTYAVLTMCRALYTLQHGTIVSKPFAARWAQKVVGEPYASLIERAVTWRDPGQAAEVTETLDFIRYTLACCQEYASQLKE